MAAPESTRRGSVDSRRAQLACIADAGLDHVGCSDHVSFFVGAGFDGLIQAAQLTSLHDSLTVYVEFEVCGVDPRTRGARTDEALSILRRLLAGETVSSDGPHFPLEGAQVLPAVDPPVPLVIGGRSNAAVRRAGRHGDGYVGVWISPRRFAGVVSQIREAADAAGRPDAEIEPALYVWCGLGGRREEARTRVSARMQELYRIDFENFEKYTPYGSADEVASFLAPYVEAGCQRFNLVPVCESDEVAVELCGEVRSQLLA
jgi:alkanesulfonate monooxygenase SsuD/methylene tetrahydromethanopterin reductase-like flavin-dependent oxidoreductase (luciferase family)